MLVKQFLLVIFFLLVSAQQVSALPLAVPDPKDKKKDQKTGLVESTVDDTDAADVPVNGSGDSDGNGDINRTDPRTSFSNRPPSQIYV